MNDMEVNSVNLWTADLLVDLLQGEWIVRPSQDWRCGNLAINEHGCVGNDTLFIAIDKERWLQGSGNRGVYADWTDTHTTVARFQKKIVGAVVERHIESLDPSIPQLRVENTYEAIRALGTYARENYSGKIIAVTGTAGKSTTKRMLHHLLETEARVVSTYGNHNTRTGVPLTLGRCITQSEYCVLEVAISALWMRSGGICRLARPHVAIITEIALGQSTDSVNSTRETARMKARIAQGIEPGGIAILNRDMEEYDLVKSEVEAHGARSLSYGFHETADVRVLEWQAVRGGSWVMVQIQDSRVRYYLPVPGKGMISNSLAALTAVHALGINPEKAVQSFASMPNNEAVLESLTVDLPGGGKVHILDDSHNATVISMKSALEVFKENAGSYTGRKICVLGRIVNLGERTELLHRELSQSVIESGVDIVFAYGREMQYLLEELPQQLIGGFYGDIKACARAVADYLEDGDYILLKGSRRANDFGKIRLFLLEAIKDSNSTGVKGSYYIPYSRYGVQAVDGLSGELIWTEGNPYAEVDQGIGGAVLLNLLLGKISSGAIKLNDYQTITSVPARESKFSGAIGLEEGESASVHLLLSAFICCSAPDAILALAEKIAGSTNDAFQLMTKVSSKWGLSPHALKNVTGRPIKARPQSFNISDLNKVGLQLASWPMAYLKMLNTSTVEYKGRLFSSSSNLIAGARIFGAYLFGTNNGEGIAITFIKNRKIILSVCGARDSFHRDYLLGRVIDRLNEREEADNRATRMKNIEGREVVINILGDTYFGEDYTIKRQKRGQEDALTKYGYDYTFQGLVPLLEKGDYNIVNFEAVLSNLKDSPLQGIKPFVLRGKVKESIAALKRFNIHGVTLGNNHAMDYGAPGLDDTLKAFERAGISAAGAGYNGKDASEPLRLKMADSELVFYSGYWYRGPGHHLFDMYALGNKPGVACLSGEIIDRIKMEKADNPHAFIIVIAHWGIDFREVQKQQRVYARQLLDSGADLIIGHGAHMMQTIEQIDGKWVVYGIGNAVFNSNGEYEKRNVPPYSFLLQLRITNWGDKSIRLYPLFCNNLKTFWQTRAVDREQFKEVIEYQAAAGTEMQKYIIDTDAFGPYMETRV